jgi:hypothetical protein
MRKKTSLNTLPILEIEKIQNPNPCSRLSKQNPKRVKKMVTQPEYDTLNPTVV